MAKKEKKVKKNQTQAGTIKLMDSVKTKLILIMALLVAVPLLVAIIISYQSSTAKAHDDALELLSATGKMG